MKTGCAFQVSCSEFIPRFVLLCEPLALLVARGPAVGVARRPAGPSRPRLAAIRRAPFAAEAYSRRLFLERQTYNTSVQRAAPFLF